MGRRMMSRGGRAIRAAVPLFAVLLVLSCPNALREAVHDLTEKAFNPDISLWQGETELPAGETFDFGQLDVGESKEVVFTIRNLGKVQLTISSVALSGTGATIFSLVQQVAGSLVEGEKEGSFTLKCAPVSAGSLSAAIAISSNDPNESSYSFTVTATAVVPNAPEMNVLQGTSSIPDNTGSHTFDPTMLTSFTDVIFTIENLGIANLYLSGSPKVQVGGTHASMFTLMGDPPSPVAPSGSTDFTIRFSPSEEVGLKSATVSITNDDTNENPYNFTLLGTATEWHGIQTVDSTGFVGSYTSIAVSGGNVCISYQDGTNADLKFAKSTDGGATWPAGSIKTADATGDVGSHSSIAVSGSDVYISYTLSLVTPGDHLRFAKSTDGGATWPAGSIKTVDSANDVGQYTSIAVDGSNVYISYYDQTNADLKFAKSINGGDSWLAGNIKTVDSTGFFGSYTSIAVNGSNVYISYYGGADGLKVAKSIDGGATWEASDINNVDAAGGWDTTIAVSGSVVHIGYYVDATSDLKYAKSLDGGATWLPGNIKTVDSAGSVGRYASIAYSASNVYIGYFVAGTNDLKFAKSSDGGDTWLPGDIKTVDSADSVGSDVSLAASGSNVYISYRDGTNSDLKFAKSSDGGTTW